MTRPEPEQAAEPATLRDTLLGILGQPFNTVLADDAFNEIALRVFAFQYARNAPYAAFCDRRSRTPRTVEHWTQVPAVPTAAFGEVPLIAGDPDRAEVVFRTSGTTRGAERRGVHYIADLSLYRAALLPTFGACVLPDSTRSTMISLVPAAHEVPDSSLSYMVDVVMQHHGDEYSTHCTTVAHGIDEHRIVTALRAAESDGRSVCLLGTSSAFVHWLDSIEAQDIRFELLAGSRIMDTGGYKGRGREVEPETLRTMYHDLLDVPESHCVNEYGMTEMCSQFYDSTLRDAARPRRKLAPAWVRTRIVDPETLEPVADRAEGLLQHFDLANANSVMAIQTEDIGFAVDDGFVMLGRVPGASPRGCSIAMDLLLEAVRDRPQ